MISTREYTYNIGEYCSSCNLYTYRFYWYFSSFYSFERLFPNTRVVNSKTYLMIKRTDKTKIKEQTTPRIEYRGSFLV